MSNLTITRSKNSVRFQGFLSRSGGQSYRDGCIIISNLTTRICTGHTYTFTYKIKDSIKNMERAGLFATSGNVYRISKYDHENGNTSYVTILESTIDTETNNGQGILIILKEGLNVPFDITISDMCIYEGAYSNPPIYVSPECNPGRTFVGLNNFYNNFYYSRGSGQLNKKGWHRIYRLYNENSNYNSWRYASEYKISLQKGYANGLYETYIIRFALHGQYSEPTTVGYYIEPNLYAAFHSASMKFTKFALGFSNGEVHLMGYYNTTVNDQFVLSVEEYYTALSSWVRDAYFIENSAANYTESRKRLHTVCIDNADIDNTLVSDTIIGSEVNTIRKTIQITIS